MYPNAGINAAVAAARHPVSQIKQNIVHLSLKLAFSHPQKLSLRQTSKLNTTTISNFPQSTKVFSQKKTDHTN